jgi:hypothetical protein
VNRVALKTEMNVQSNTSMQQSASYLTLVPAGVTIVANVTPASFFLGSTVLLLPHVEN